MWFDSYDAQLEGNSNYLRFINHLSKHYTLKSGNFPNLNNFSIINSNYDVELIGGFKIKLKNKHNCNIFIIRYSEMEYKFSEYTPYGGDFDSTAYNYIFIKITLNKNWGKALIRPETVQDKIRELFIKEEIDFKSHKTFSENYYVLAKNKLSFIENMNNDILSFLEKTPGLTIEFLENECIFRLPKANHFKEAIQLIEIAEEIVPLLNQK